MRSWPVQAVSARPSAASSTSLIRARYTRRNAAQQGVGVLGAQLPVDRPDVLDRTRVGDRGGVRRGGPPVIGLAVEAALRRVLLQPPGPLREGGAARTEVGLLAGRQLPVRDPQVVEQDAPGDAVDDQVVRGQEQLGCPAAAQVEQHRPQQRSLGEVAGPSAAGQRPPPPPGPAASRPAGRTGRAARQCQRPVRLRGDLLRATGRRRGKRIRSASWWADEGLQGPLQGGGVRRPARVRAGRTG